MLYHEKKYPSTEAIIAEIKRWVDKDLADDGCDENARDLARGYIMTVYEDAYEEDGDAADRNHFYLDETVIFDALVNYIRKTHPEADKVKSTFFEN